ncbi:MAG: LysE family transporter [Candidatus Thorarchaeota archaeon]
MAVLEAKTLGVIEILAAWFALSLTGALAPGPLSAAVIMQANRHGRLHGMLPMVGHAIVELGIVAAIILSVNALVLDAFTISLLIGFGGAVIIAFGLLALRDYRFSAQEETEAKSAVTPVTVVEATAQGAAVSLLSPYFLLWWFGIGLANVTMLVAELQVGLGTVFLAGILIYLTHISTDFGFGAFLTVGTDFVKKRSAIGGINWVNVAIGLFQVVLGIWFVLMALY